MLNQYFGQYLLNKGLLSSEQLQDVMVCERSVRPKLGVLAMDAGLMTAAQVEEVHALQHTVDKKFGEIAVSRKYLSIEQLENLLKTQNSKRLSLSQAIVDKGYLSLAQLENALEAYKRENSLTSKQLEALLSGDLEEIARMFLNLDAANKTGNVMYSYVALVMRAIVRFLEVEPILTQNGQSVAGHLISQKLSGNVNMTTGLVMADNVLLEMAKRYSGENLHTVDELALDCIAEFLNETNGIFIVNMSEQGLDFELQPPQVLQGGGLPKGGQRISFATSLGPIDLFLEVK